ncbi:Alpha/Beta hydrolase protein [Xylariales sp. PMI_506]|nr:Alpha/Beta hydrolase protein [Xylariales sp. PMI_506]
MAPGQTPTGKTRLTVDGLGVVEGLAFDQGVSQYVGIPYANLAKRWTRSVLNTSWPNDFHDGTKLGTMAPQPPEYTAPDPIIPVGDIPHHGTAEEDEMKCLVVNVTAPPIEPGKKYPVMVYIHGGSLLYGSGNRSIFDGVNFVTHALNRDTPVVAVVFNYRVGLGGFLASAAIKEDLARDGFEGTGNFGLWDQHTLLHWVNRYISAFGGDPEEVTVYGESAGSMSVAHQIYAKNPAPFKRGVLMSGHLNTIPVWSVDHHEKHYRALLEYLKIDRDAPDTLEQLRAVPQDVIAKATLPVEGVFVCSGNPCDDGVFHAKSPQFRDLESPPAWLKGYMVGDTYDEGVIFRGSFMEDDYDSVRVRFEAALGVEKTQTILDLYGVTPNLVRLQFLEAMEVMAGDAIFKLHNWVGARRSTVPQTFGYHFDQVSTYDNVLKGLAYHAIDLLYVFLNFDEHLDADQRQFARVMANHFLDFAYGKDPWPRYSDGGKWMRYGPNSKYEVVNEEQDEPVRHYSRMKQIEDMGIMQEFFLVIDEISGKRWRMGTFEWNAPHWSQTQDSDAPEGK